MLSATTSASPSRSCRENVSPDIAYLHESPRYLITGCILATLGYVVAFISTVLQLQSGETRDGRVYEIPGSISVMVADWTSPEARIFFGFEMAAANCLLLSWYPFKLRNACCIPAFGGCSMPIGCCMLSWASFRQFVVPVGMILSTCCPITSTWNQMSVDLVLMMVHATAAVSSALGWILSEAHTISLRVPFTNFRPCHCRAPVECQPIIEGRQYKARLVVWLVGVMAYIVYAVTRVAGKVSPSCWWWRFISLMTDIIGGLAMCLNLAIIHRYSDHRFTMDLATGRRMSSSQEIQLT